MKGRHPATPTRARPGCCWRHHLPQSGNWGKMDGRGWTRSTGLGIDAIILADPGLMGYALKTHPQLRLHPSVQGLATSYEAINLPPPLRHPACGVAAVLSLAQVEQVIASNPVETGVGFGAVRDGRGAARCRPTPPVNLQLQRRLPLALCALGADAQGHGRYASTQTHDRFWRWASVPATRRCKGTLRGQWRDLICHRGAHQPQHSSSCR